MAGSIPARSTDAGPPALVVAETYGGPREKAEFTITGEPLVLDPDAWIRFDSLEALNAQTNAAIREHVGCGCDEPPREGGADDFTIRLYNPAN